MGLSCLLLAYSAYVVPMQLSFWITDDLCNPFPTLYSDIFVDSYFLVRFHADGLLQENVLSFIENASGEGKRHATCVG